jgi:hypothetical protein
VTSATSQGNPKTKELVDFVQDLHQITDNHLHGSLAGKRVAVLGRADRELVSALVAAKVDQMYVVNEDSATETFEGVTHILAHPLHGPVPQVDVLLFDARRHANFDHVTGVALLVAQMRKVLSASGILFCLLKTGTVNHAFDVYNPIVRTNSGFLPSYEFLLGNLLAACAVRPLAWLPPVEPFETLRFFRVSLKKPTLLLILGRSQSGKTSLARDLHTLDPQMHVSTDYVYCEIVERLGRGATGIPEVLARHVGDGSGKACGDFNRALESNQELLSAYLSWIIGLLPRTKQIVSVEFDVLKDEAVATMKEMLSSAGFSVWVVRR